MQNPYFNDTEIAGLDETFVAVLTKARHRAGTPFVLTETVATGGSHAANTSHGRGLGVDIRCHDSRSRFLILEALFAIGFTRIGIYDRHLHVDFDSSLDQSVVWLGTSH